MVMVILCLLLTSDGNYFVTKPLCLWLAFILLYQTPCMHNLILFSFAEEIHDWRGLLITLFIGAVAGFLAQVITPGRGYGTIVTIIIGIVGGWIGKILFKNYLSFTSIPLINTIICATAGAFILALVVNLIIGSDDGDRTSYRA